MKKIARFVLVAALSLVALHAADQVPHFNATLTVGKEHRFVLISVAGQTSSFLRLGDSFEGYALKSYDAKSGELTLEKDGTTVNVSLMSDAAVANGPAVAIKGTIADAEAVMNKIHIEDLLERTFAQQKKMIAANIARSGANVPPEMRADFEAFQQKVMDEVNRMFDVGQLKGDLTRIYSETFTKQELDGISAFYDTPLGQTLLAKQPEVQEKMQAAMLPRMAELGPKIQKMSQEFGAAVRAKKAAASAGGAAPAPVPAEKQ
jgi:hypothetical protein